MKIIWMSTVIVLASCAFALTETVNGVKWDYYITPDGNAVLEYPGIRDLKSRPPVMPTGIISKVLCLPEHLGNCTVTNVGAVAVQLDEEENVEMIIVPSNYKTISVFAMAGSFLRSESNYGARVHRWKHLNEVGCTNILFLGDCPNVVADYHWTAGDTSVYVSGEYGIQYEPSDQFSDCNCFIVEGTQGWPITGRYCQGNVKYGAVKVEYSRVGIIEKGSYISLSSPNKGARIYYTIDGSDPTTNSTDKCFTYSESIEVKHRTTIKALAYVASYPYTVIYSNSYAFGQVLLPAVISRDGAIFNWSDNMITLSCETDDADIRYTLDGSEPTEQSTLYVGPFAIDDTTTVKAKAFKTDWFDSETVTATFTREWYTVEQPIVEPSEMTFGNVSQEVSISCETDGATILYTTDGSDPAVNGREYKHPFDIYQSCTVRAIARKYDWKDSPEATATFTRSDSLSEAANLYGYTMETDATYPWTVVTDVSHDGVSSVRSGEIDNGGTTYLQTSVRKAGTVSFWWKAMCEEAEVEDGETYYYDFGSFSVDGDVKARIAGNDTGWQFVSVDVPSGGKHTLRWEYAKDDSTSYAPDCMWLDQVQWTPADGSGFTMTTPEPVPYSWLSNYGFGGLEADFETAANSLNGKRDGAGKQLSVWQDYVAGTDPTNVASRLKARIEMRGDEPFITWEPDLNENGTKAVRLYKVYGSETLDGGGDWQYPTNSLHRFFKVTVEMP